MTKINEKNRINLSFENAKEANETQHSQIVK